MLADILKFRSDRDWDKFHTPRNLEISISLEAAEPLENFQWQVGEEPITPEIKDRASKEMADIFTYLLSMSHDAIQVLDQAIQLDPQNADAWSEKGYALTELGKYDEAMQVLDQAIQLDPQNAEAWGYKSYTLELHIKTAEAEAAYTKANELGNASLI